jgi:GT2 family glycosyltransferase
MSPRTVSAAPRIAAIVLNWNRFEATRACVESLRGCGYGDLRIVVVDNGSHDGSAERLERELPGLQLHRNGANLGFSRGCNAGIRIAMADPACRYVLLVNNDCTIARGGLDAAVRAAEDDPRVGIVTGKIVDDEGRIWHAGGTISRLRGQAIARGFGERDLGQYEEACDTRWASGAMMLVRREAIEKAGALPEEYFFGVEEWDYSLNVLRSGLRIRYVPGFAGIHPGSGSHHNHDPKFVYNYYRNKLLFQRRQLGALLFPVWLLAFRAYLRTRMRRHVAEIARTLYAGSPYSVDDLVFAARAALRDHGTGPLSEETMLDFDRRLRAHRSR